MKWFPRVKLEPGWLVVALDPNRLTFVHGRNGASEKSVVTRCGSYEFDGVQGGIEKLTRELQVEHCQCATMLRPGEYQMLQVEAPNVPQAELKNAIRWRIKDMVDYRVDDATVDVLDIPLEDGSGAPRAHSMYAIAARNDVIQARIKEFEAARIPLSVIDIPETAQRNVAALYESAGQGLALLHFEQEHGLLTITFKAELYLARRIELGTSQLAAAPVGGRREALFGRILLELQRTFDHFERQYRAIAVARLLLGPEPEDSGIADYLRASLGMPVERADLGNVIALPDSGLAQDAQWRLFHLIGASLRHQSKAL